MADSARQGIRFTRDGHHVAFLEGAALKVVSIPGLGARAVLPTPGLIDFAVFDDQIWIVKGESPELTSYSLTGEQLAGPVALPGGGPARLHAAPFGAPSAVWLASRAALISESGERLETEALEGAFDFAVPLGSDVVLAARENTLWLRRAGQQQWSVRHREMSGSSVRDACALFEGRTICVVTEAEDAQHLLVLGARDGGLHHRLRLRAITGTRVAARRGYAVLRGGERKLLAIDLRFGKVVKSFDERRPILDFAIDDAAQHMVLKLDSEEGRKTVYTTFREFLSALAGGSVVSGAGGEDGSGAEEEPAERRDARWRHEARAATRRSGRRGEEEDDRGAEDDGPLPRRTLHRMAPLPRYPLCTREQGRELLDIYLETVGSWCEMAIATAWDCGQLAFADDGDVPFEHEVAGILGRSQSSAREKVAAAEAHVAEASARAREAERALGERLSPLQALAREFKLSHLAAEILMVVAAPTLWGELARLYGILANDPDRALCDELLVSQILGFDRVARAEVARELDPDQPLRHYGLIATEGNAARPFLALVPAPEVIRRLRMDASKSAPGDVIKVRGSEKSLEELIVPRRLLRELLEALELTSGDGFARLVVRGRLGSGRRTLLAAVAEAANRRLGRIDVGLLGSDLRSRLDGLEAAMSEALLRGLVPCIEGLPDAGSLEEGERDQLRELFRSYPGPLGFRMPQEASPPIDPGYLAVDLPPLGESERLRCWQDVVARFALEGADVETLAGRFRVGPGIIEQVASRVADDRRAAQNGASRDETAALDAALRQHVEVRLGSVASRVSRLATWSSVVLPEDVTDSLLELIARIRHRRTVFDDWGFDRKMSTSRGLSVLFQGPPGTGKTMVAGVIARELGLDLYRIDLSRIMSKWIGETEQNLASVFDAAEDGQAIILFDEADSLFAKRTEVKSSVDRYANLEVNYLLQRLDSFEGIALLTTNFGGSIDRAFMRRMSMRLSFPFPDEEMREQLWRVHLPPEVPTAGDFDFPELAQRYRLSGGYIRNAALRAAFLAAQEGTAVTQEHLERAIRLEYREVGKLAETGVLE